MSDMGLWIPHTLSTENKMSDELLGTVLDYQTLPKYLKLLFILYYSFIIVQKLHFMRRTV